MANADVHQITQEIMGHFMRGLVAELRADRQTSLAQWLESHTVESAIRELTQGLTTALTTMHTCVRQRTGNPQARQNYNQALDAFDDQAPWLNKMGKFRELEERLKSNIAPSADLVGVAGKAMSTYISMLRVLEVYKGDERRYDYIHRNVLAILQASYR